MLKHIRIRNFRSCADTKVPFLNSVTGLAGRNGVGKTNILQAINWFTKSVIKPEPLRHDTFLRPSRPVAFEMTACLGRGTYEYCLTFSSPDDKQPQSANDPIIQETISLNRGEDTEPLLQRHGEEVTLSHGRMIIRISRSTAALAVLPALLPDSAPVISDLRNLRDFCRTVTYYPLVIPEGRLDFVTESQYQKWLARFILDQEPTESVAFRLLYMWHEDRALWNEFASIIGRDGLNLIDSVSVDEFTLPVNGDDPADSNKPSMRKLFYPFFMPAAEMGGAGYPFPFSDLSAGTQRIVQIVVSMLFDKATVMLMEQPEDCIHPALLRKVLDTLRSYSGDTQVVFSTHSPTVLDSLLPEEVVLVTAPTGETIARTLHTDELLAARHFLEEEGALSDFFETLDEP